MFLRCAILAMLAVSFQYVDFSSAEEDCLQEFVTNKFASFKPDTNIQLENFRTNGSNFYLEAEAELSDLNVVERQEDIEITGVSANLLFDPSFRVEFVYNLNLTVEGNHMSYGTILSRRRFYGEGKFNASSRLQANLAVDVKIQPTPAGYLEVLNISTSTIYAGGTDDSLYLEKITDADFFDQYKHSMRMVFGSISALASYQFELSVISAVEEFLSKQIPETYLTDICIPPVM